MNVADMMADKVDRFGAIWKQSLTNGFFADKPAMVGAWVLHCPKAHPFWSYYLVSVIHLRPVDGLPNAVAYEGQGGTHEVMVAALDPEVPVIYNGPYRILEPINVAQQFIAPDDASAKTRVYEAAVECIVGTLSPDSDFRSMWADKFNSNPTSTVKH